jgi:hypothetical protein
MRQQDGAEELAALLFALVTFLVTFGLLVTKAVSRWTYRLLARSYRAYWPHPALVCWTLASGVSLALAALIVLVSERPMAYLGIGLVLVGSAVSLAILDAVLGQLNQQPAPDAELPSGTDWPTL